MSTSINQLLNTGSTSQATSSSSSAGSNAILGQSEFLQLLTTQLQNQDPLNPMDDTQSVAELAQFSALQSTTNLADSFSAFQSNFAVTQAAGLIGKTVSASATDSSGNTQSITGVVKTIGVVNGVPEMTLMGPSGAILTDSNGVAYQVPTSDILSIGNTATSSTGTATTSAITRL